MKKYQINSISGHQTGKIVALVMVILSLFFALFTILLFVIAEPDEADLFALLPFILMPIIYFIIGYLTTRLFCFIYNKLRPKFGGIEFELKEAEISD